MAIKWPGVVTPGTTSTEPVVTHDLFCTIMEIAGVPYRKDYADGVSLVPLLRGEAGDLGRDAIFWHYPHYHHQGGRPSSVIRQGDYKLIEWFEGSMLGLGPAVELFNVVGDIGETHDLADKMPERVAAMRAKLEAWRKDVGAQMMQIRSPQVSTK